MAHKITSQVKGICVVYNFFLFFFTLCVFRSRRQPWRCQVQQIYLGWMFSSGPWTLALRQLAEWWTWHRRSRPGSKLWLLHPFLSLQLLPNSSRRAACSPSQDLWGRAVFWRWLWSSCSLGWRANHHIVSLVNIYKCWERNLIHFVIYKVRHQDDCDLLKEFALISQKISFS